MDLLNNVLLQMIRTSNFVVETASSVTNSGLIWRNTILDLFSIYFLLLLFSYRWLHSWVVSGINSLLCSYQILAFWESSIVCFIMRESTDKPVWMISITNNDADISERMCLELFLCFSYRRPKERRKSESCRRLETLLIGDSCQSLGSCYFKTPQSLGNYLEAKKLVVTGVETKRCWIAFLFLWILAYIILWLEIKIPS